MTRFQVMCIAGFIVLLVACGSSPAEIEQCNRLCETSLDCSQGFALESCLNWCDTLDERNNELSLHPKMIDCLDITDCEAYNACIADAQTYVNGERPVFTTDAPETE